VKFVQKDAGKTLENSTGGGSEGLLKETIILLASYVAVIFFAILFTLIVIWGIVTFL
jgi:hypothetical protein